MASSLKTSFLGAIQAASSVLLTLSYGVGAARYGLVHDRSVADISKLCVNIFLPALLFTNVGEHLNVDSLGDYIPVFRTSSVFPTKEKKKKTQEKGRLIRFLVWALIYAFASIGVGMAATEILRLPAWVTPAMAFNNSTSLPLLLVMSLAATGVLKPLTGDDVDGAINRVKSYFLVNSMVSDTLTFVLGPMLMSGDQDRGGDGENHRGENAYDEADEETLLLPRPIFNTKKTVEGKFESAFHALHPRVQGFFLSLPSMATPPLLGAVLAVVIGLVPALHRAFFADMQDGGWLRAWLTSSVKNVGELFTALQMFVVGSELYKSMDGKEKVGRIPKTGLGLLFAVRFVVWPA